MWICLNDGVFSIVRPFEGSAPQHSLLVRARRDGDIQRHWPDAEVIEMRNADYRFRAFIPERDVAEEVIKRLFMIEYTNFKESVEDSDLHLAYLGAWSSFRGLTPEE
jgi:hypothetical protein